MPARVHPAWMGWDGIDCGYWCMDGGALKSAPGFGFVILDEDPHDAFQPNKISEENLLALEDSVVPKALIYIKASSGGLIKERLKECVPTTIEAS